MRKMFTFGNWEMSPGKKHKWQTEEPNLGEEFGASLRYVMCEAEACAKHGQLPRPGPLWARGGWEQALSC